MNHNQTIRRNQLEQLMKFDRSRATWIIENMDDEEAASFDDAVADNEGAAALATASECVDRITGVVPATVSKAAPKRRRKTTSD